MATGLELIRTPEGPTGPVELVDPDTAEVVPLENATPQLVAAVLGRLKAQEDEFKESVGQARRWLGERMIERMDVEHEWTVRARGVKVSAPSPAAKSHTWDPELLQATLDDLVKEALVSRDAALRACRQDIAYTPVVAGINKLLKDDRIAARILVCRREVEPPARSVRIEVDHGEI